MRYVCIFQVNRIEGSVYAAAASTQEELPKRASAKLNESLELTDLPVKHF